MIYTEEVTPTGQEYIKRENADGTISNIPKDPANSDYQRYLRWLEDPNAEENQGGLN